MNSIIFKLRVKIGHVFRNLPIVLQVRYLFLIVHLARKSGSFKSLRRGPVDNFANPIPWLTPSSLDFITSIDLASSKMIEFGAGHSTLWFSKRVMQIISYECDEKWISKLRSEYQYQGVIYLVDNNFDGKGVDFSNTEVVLVDGLDRTNIVMSIVRNLSKEEHLKLLIIDNPQFVDPSVLDLLSVEFFRIDFVGLPNSSWLETTTTIFIRRSDTSLLN